LGFGQYWENILNKGDDTMSYEGKLVESFAESVGRNIFDVSQDIIEILLDSRMSLEELVKDNEVLAEIPIIKTGISII
jgi:hypothetical protein